MRLARHSRIAIIVALALLAAACSEGCHAAPASRPLSPAAGSPTTTPDTRTPWQVVLAAPGGAVVAGANARGGALTEGWDSHGRLVWRRQGLGVAVSAGLPAAALSYGNGFTAQGEPLFPNLVVVDGKGRTTLSQRFPGARVTPLQCDARRLVYLLESKGRTALVVVQRGATQVLRLSARGSVSSASASADGSRVAVASPQQTGYRINWIRVTAAGRPVLVRAVTSVHPAAFLSPDGAHAVLAGDRPAYVRFASSQGRPIRGDYVSDAHIAAGRLCVLTVVGTNGVLTTAVRIETTDGRALWSTSLAGDARVHVDAALRFLSYRDPASHRATVVNVLSGKVGYLERAVDDVAVVDARLVAVCGSSGRVAFLANPCPS